MKGSIAAAVLMALVTAGSVSVVEPAAAAKVITVARASPVYGPRHHRAHLDERAAIRPYGSPYYAGWTYYYGRPFYYMPAPFPLGFDFGFGW